MVQCPTCGAEVEEDTDICPECGTELRAAVPAGGASAEEGAAAQPAAQQAAPPSATMPQEPQAPAPEAEAPPTPVPVHIVTAAGPATLTLKRAGAVTSEVFSLGDRVTIGRFDAETGPVDVDLGPLPEAMYISRQHAEIFKVPEGRWMIRDLGSSNGTFVRDPESGKFERVKVEQEIKDGDEIALGNARFVFNAG